MNACKVYTLETVADFVAGRLDDAETAAMHRHLAGCPQCRAAADRLRRLHEAMLRSDALAARHVPAEDHARIMQEAALMAASPYGRRTILKFTRGSLIRIAATAAAAAVILVGAWVLEHRSRPQRGTDMAVAIDVRGKIFLDGNQTALKSGESLKVGSRVRTGRDSRLTMTLADGASVELNENTTVGLDGWAEGRALCQVSEGEIFVAKTAPKAAETPALLVVRTPVGSVETAAKATFDLKVVPRTVASLWTRFSLTPLAFEGGDVLGNVGPEAEVRLTVLEGRVTFRPAGGEPLVVEADSLLAYDPSDAKPSVRRVETQRYVLWRLADDQVFAMAKPLLAELFAARLVTPLPGQRVRLDYDFLSSAEFEHDWTYRGQQWRLYLNYLRLRAPGAAEQPAGERPEIATRATFIGDPEVNFDVTVDPVRDSSIGWALRSAADAGASTPVAGSADVSFKGQGRIDLRLAIDGKPDRAETHPSPGPAFNFGGRIEDDMAYVLLGPTQEESVAAMAEAVPDATLRRLHDADRPEPLRIVIRAAGPDVIINRITILAQPDPRWLRAALADLFLKQDQAGW